MKAMIRKVDDRGLRYDALAFVCPGCKEFGGSGIHMLPVNSENKSPSWDWNEDFEKPTLTPSILTNKDGEQRCHSFLRSGVFHFLSDSLHSMKGQEVPMPDLPDWFTNE